MRKILGITSLAFLSLSACSQSPVVEQQAEVEEKVVFDLPELWLLEPELTDDEASVSYVNGEDSIIVKEIANPDGLSVPEYIQSEYDNCKAENPDPEDAAEMELYVPSCWQYLIDEELWTQSEVDGHKVYRSSITGIPESGAQKEEWYLELNNKIVQFMVYYIAGEPQRSESEASADQIFNSLGVE